MLDPCLGLARYGRICAAHPCILQAGTCACTMYINPPPQMWPSRNHATSWELATGITRDAHVIPGK